jgi:splicing factor 3B subunit 3
MYLYNLTLQRATGITHAIHGNFSGSKIQEILIAHGKSLELVRPDPNTGKVHTLLQTEVFGIIRSMMSFRLTGSTKGKNNETFDNFWLALLLMHDTCN